MYKDQRGPFFKMTLLASWRVDTLRQLRLYLFFCTFHVHSWTQYTVKSEPSLHTMLLSLKKYDAPSRELPQRSTTPVAAASKYRSPSALEKDLLFAPRSKTASQNASPDCPPVLLD